MAANKVAKTKDDRAIASVMDWKRMRAPHPRMAEEPLSLTLLDESLKVTKPPLPPFTLHHSHAQMPVPQLTICGEFFRAALPGDAPARKDGVPVGDLDQPLDVLV